MTTNERGFTIVEILVAVMILSVGILGLASTAALVTRMIGQGQRYTEASTIANDRFEQLRSMTCADLADGTEAVGGYNVNWQTSALGNRGANMTVTVTVPTPGRADPTYTFTSTRLCP